MRLLIVEDQAELRHSLAKQLRIAGYSVDEASTLEAAQLQLQTHSFSILILDRMLPDGDAADSLAKWRRNGLQTPIILLTAKGRLEDRVAGLQAGADDYLVKPFAMEELLARIAAVARRQGNETPSIVIVGDLEIDLARRQAHRNCVLLPLRPKEYAVLEYLATRLGQAVARQELRDACWDHRREAHSNVEEAVVATLRRKLGDPAVVHTIRGFGYVLEEGHEDSH